MQNILNYLAGPLIGSVIGYCTNYIAVKMLFLPRKEIRIGGFKVPFTPGAIPKGKPRLAKAIGNIVGNTLLTKEDITKQLMNGGTEEKIIDQAMLALHANLKQSVCGVIGSEDYELTKEKLTAVISDAMMESVGKFDMKTIVVSEGGRIIKEKTAGTMLAMFVSDELIQSFTEPAGAEIEAYFQEHGKEKIVQEIEEKFDLMEEKSFMELLYAVGVNDEKIRKYVSGIYHGLISNAMDGIMRQLNVTQLVEDKVNEMNVLEVEELMLTVMKKELNTIVNLGAVIGFVLGLLNIFI